MYARTLYTAHCTAYYTSIAESDAQVCLCAQLEQRIAAESHGTAAVREERVRLEEQMAAAEGTRKVLEAQIQQLQVETHSYDRFIITELLILVNALTRGIRGMRCSFQVC